MAKKKISKSNHKEMKPTLKKDGYTIRHGDEIRDIAKAHKKKSSPVKPKVKKKSAPKPKKSNSEPENMSMSARNQHSGNENVDTENRIKRGGYKIRPVEEVREMMEENMHAAAYIKPHSSKGLIPAEGLDESYTGSQRPTRKNKVTDLHHGQKKLMDDPYYEVAEEDSIQSYKRAGCTKNTGAEDDKDSLEWARNMRMGARTSSNFPENSSAKKRRK